MRVKKRKTDEEKIKQVLESIPKEDHSYKPQFIDMKLFFIFIGVGFVLGIIIIVLLILLTN